MNIRFASAVPQFPVPDVVSTARYYERVFGFDVAGYWDGEHVHGDDRATVLFGIVQRDGVRLHFNRTEHAGSRPERTDGGYDVYFNVSGLDDLARDLARRGADILEGPEERSYGQKELVVRDCNGLVLAFGEQISRSEADVDRDNFAAQQVLPSDVSRRR